MNIKAKDMEALAAALARYKSKHGVQVLSYSAPVSVNCTVQCGQSCSAVCKGNCHTYGCSGTCWTGCFGPYGLAK